MKEEDNIHISTVQYLSGQTLYSSPIWLIDTRCLNVFIFHIYDECLTSALFSSETRSVLFQAVRELVGLWGMSFSPSSNHHKGTPHAWRHWQPVIQPPSRRRSDEGRERVRATHGAWNVWRTKTTCEFYLATPTSEAGDRNRTFNACVRHTFQYRVHFDLRQGRQREGWGGVR